MEAQRIAIAAPFANLLKKVPEGASWEPRAIRQRRRRRRRVARRRRGARGRPGRGSGAADRPRPTGHRAAPPAPARAPRAGQPRAPRPPRPPRPRPRPRRRAGARHAGGGRGGPPPPGRPVGARPRHGVGGGVAAVRARRRHRVGADRGAPAAGAAGAARPPQARRREAADQRQRAPLRDLAQHPREVPRHAARLQRARVFLRRGRQGVLLRPRPGHLPAHPQLLPHGEAALPEARVPHQLRRGAGVLRHPARRHRRLLLRGLPRQEARERGAADGRQAVRERGPEPAAADQHPAEDVARVREPAHLDGGARLLLRHRLLHRRLRDGERRGDGAVRQPARRRRLAAVRRALQDRLLLPGHRLRDDLHRGVPAADVRRPEPLQVCALRHEHHRRGGHPAVLHRPRHHGQRRRLRRVRHAARLPRLPDIQVLAALAGPADPRVHPQVVRLRARLPRLLARDGDHHLRDRHVLRGEERRQDVHLDPGRLLVHHRHHDHARIRRHGSSDHCGQNRRWRLLSQWRAGDRSTSARYRLEFQQNIPPKPAGRQTESPKESPPGAHPHREGLLRRGVRQQEEGRGGAARRAGVRHRAGRQLPRRGHLRAAAPPPAALPGEDDRPRVRRARGAVQRPRAGARQGRRRRRAVERRRGGRGARPRRRRRLALAARQPGALDGRRRLRRPAAGVLRQVLPQALPAHVRQVHAGGVGGADQPDRQRHGRHLPRGGLLLGAHIIVGDAARRGGVPVVPGNAVDQDTEIVSVH